MFSIAKANTYKLNILTWKAINKQAPQYIKDLLEPFVPPGATIFAVRRLEAPTLATQFNHRKVFADRSFEYLAPVYWNALPPNIHNVTDYEVLKKLLKTHYFKLAFGL